MKLIRLVFLSPLLLAVLTGSVMAQRAELPDIKVGDRWKTEQRDRRTGIKEVEFVRVITAVTPEKIEGTWNNGQLLLTPELNLIDSPAISSSNDKSLSFPLEVGKKWSYKNNWVNKTRSDKGHEEVDVVVVAYEKVKVAVGEFDAFKVEAKGYWNNDSNGQHGRTTRTYWFAPAARSVVKAENDDGYNRWVREVVEMQLQQ